MEILQLVRVRGARWRVIDVRSHDACRVVTAAGADPESRGEVRRFLVPFDDVEPVAADARAHRVGLRRWRRACRALIASDTPPDALATAARARIDVLPHQLAPALSVLRGNGSRVLLADEVGLGKTIQAGLILAELAARHAVDRVLILTPAGLRSQWHDELTTRFAMAVAHADAPALRRHCAGLPPGENPWTATPMAIASLDYVKRPEVLPAVAACSWDVVVVDEAHTAVGDSDRCAAVQALAARAPYVVLLTATPHNGDDRAFATLCGIGDVEDGQPLLVFRRTRDAIRGDAVRRVHTLRVRPSAAERRMLDALVRFRRAVRREHGSRALALSVLDKRAWSSAWSLAQSVDRRLQTLAGTPLDGLAHQLALPLANTDGDLDTADEAPLWPDDLALSNATRERHLLTAVSAAAHAAVRGSESKVDALRRLLRRSGEPAIVFTEYRDTAEHVCRLLGTPLLLHGGLNRAARAAVLDAFATDGRAILVATDAAGQGLNLQARCRLVVNLELPWNPMRLEQRIGRVDRIGQRRRVHAVHLVAARTAEERLRRRLRRRIASARRTIGAPDPLSASQPANQRRATRRPAPPLIDESASEAARLAMARRFLGDDHAETIADLQTTRWWVARARRSRLRTALAGRALFVFRMAVESTAGRTMASRLVPLLVDPAAAAAPADALPASLADDWVEHVKSVNSRFWRTRIGREQRIADAAAGERPALFQPALFSQQPERAQAQLVAEQQRFTNASRARLANARRQSTVERAACELLLVLLPR